MRNQGEPRFDNCWRKSRLAARILLREQEGRLTARDVRIGRALAQDKEVLPRLIQQAIYAIQGRRYQLEHPGGQAA